MSKLDEIKKALQAATPGPWAMIEPIDEVWQSIDNTKIATVASNQDADANLHLIANAPEWLRFLLDELERLEREYAEERAAHNAHVTELIEKEEECRKLREERDAYYNNARYTEAAFHEVTSLRSQLQSAQQEIEQYKQFEQQYNEFKKSWEKYQQDKEKMIEGLHNYMKELDRRYQKAYRNYDIDCDHHQLGMAEAYEVAERRLRDILKEIGVTGE